MTPPPLLSPLPEPTRRERPWRRRWQRWLDMSTVYLPVLLMGLMALASYWLLRATPGETRAAPAPLPAGEPDYFMRGFAVKVFEPDGRLRAEVSGAEVRHRPDADTLEVDQARVRSLGDDGVLTIARAQRASTNREQTHFVLDGDAVVVREASGAAPRLEIRGQQLHIGTDPQRVWSALPVEVQRGGDTASAERLDYQGGSETLVMEGRVRMRLQGR